MESRETIDKSVTRRFGVFVKWFSKRTRSSGTQKKEEEEENEQLPSCWKLLTVFADFVCKPGFGIFNVRNSCPVISAYSFFIASGMMTFDRSIDLGRLFMPNSDSKFFSICTCVSGSGFVRGCAVVVVFVASSSSWLIRFNLLIIVELVVVDVTDDEDDESSVLATCTIGWKVASTAMTKSHARMVACTSVTENWWKIKRERFSEKSPTSIKLKNLFEKRFRLQPKVNKNCSKLSLRKENRTCLMSMVLFISTIYFQLFEITSSSFVVNENKIVRWENGKKKSRKIVVAPKCSVIWWRSRSGCWFICVMSGRRNVTDYRT